MIKKGESLISLRDIPKKKIVKWISEIDSPLKSWDTTKKMTNIVLMFDEPSTRTKYGFEIAAKNLGHNTIDFMKDESSLKKGESLVDTVRVFSGYGVDILIIRHSERNIINYMSSLIDCPVINAGNGDGEHPVQTLIDLYMIYKKFGRFTNLNITICGDLQNARTAHGLSHFLSQYKTNKLSLVSPQPYTMPPEYLLRKNYEEFSILKGDLLAKTDVLYVTRPQTERGTTEYIFDNVFVTKEKVSHMKDNSIILHPMPRTRELPVDIDDDERAWYMKRNQMSMAVYKRVIESMV